MPRWRGSLHHIIVSYIFGLHFCRRKIRYIFNYFHHHHHFVCSNMQVPFQQYQLTMSRTERLSSSTNNCPKPNICWYDKTYIQYIILKTNTQKRKIHMQCTKSEIKRSKFNNGHHSLDITLKELRQIDVYDRFLEPGQWREVNISRQWIPNINNSFGEEI